MKAMNPSDVKTGLRLVLEIARAVCDEYQATGLPVAQVPLYAACLNTINWQGWQGIMRVLAGQGFEVTAETIQPGPELRKMLEA